MKKIILAFLIATTFFTNAQTLIKLYQLERSSPGGKIVMTNTAGVATYSNLPTSGTGSVVMTSTLSNYLQDITGKLAVAGSATLTGLGTTASPYTVTAGGGGGIGFPKARYVYLVADASDQTLYGGTSANTYTTAQSAYDAANALQVVLGGTNKVVINVGNITSAQAGAITLTANINTNVIWQGQNWVSSKIGNITGTNASGNAFNIGSASANLYLYNISVASLITTATGTSGNSGDIYINGSGFNITNGLDLRVTNASNTTGNCGSLNMAGFANITTNTSNFASDCFIGNITTGLPSGSSGTGGGITIQAGSSVSFGNITATNIKSGVTVNAHGGTITARIININTASNITTSLEFFKVYNTVTIITGGNVNIRPGFYSSGITVNTSGILIIDNCRISAGLTTNSTTQCIIRSCNIDKITDLGANSNIIQTTIGVQTALVNPSVDGIGSGCAFYNCTIMGGSFSIDNPSPVNVTFTSTFSSHEIAPGANITLL